MAAGSGGGVARGLRRARGSLHGRPPPHPPSPEPASPSAGRGRGGDAESRPGRVSARPRGEVQGVPGGGGRAGLAGARPEGVGRGKSLGACQEHSAHNNLAENTAAAASRNPGLAQCPAGAPLGGAPRSGAHYPLGGFPVIPQVPALSNHPRREDSDHGSDSTGEGRPGLPQLPEQPAADSTPLGCDH